MGFIIAEKLTRFKVSLAKAVTPGARLKKGEKITRGQKWILRGIPKCHVIKGTL